MTLEPLKMLYRELSPGFRVLVALMMTAGAAAVYATKLAAHEQSQNERLDAVELRATALEGSSAEDRPVLRYVGCREKMRDEGRDPAGCRALLSPSAADFLEP